MTEAVHHASFAEFYPFYLSEHNNSTCRRLHFAGSTLSLLCLAMLAYKGFPRWFARPLLGGEFLNQPARWNRQTMIGSAIFGIGWGLSGVCPGPAIAALGTGNTDILWALGGIVLGGLTHGLTTRD